LLINCRRLAGDRVGDEGDVLVGRKSATLGFSGLLRYALLALVELLVESNQPAGLAGLS
jgi:hypothetical protein